MLTTPKLKLWIASIYKVGLGVFVFSAIIGLVYALYFSPPDYLHGELVRILYLHVPAAWLSLAIYALMGVCSFFSFRSATPFYSLCAQSLAIPGCILTAVCMLTGSLWGKQAWGVWWVWDARLTSVVVLFFLYVGYLNLCDGIANRAASVLNVAGLINLPIIKWSFDWWFTLHQPSSISLTKKSAIASEMLIPLLIMLVVFCAWSLAIFSRRFTYLLEAFQRKRGYV